MKNWPLNSAFLLNLFLKVIIAALDNDPSRKHTYSAPCYPLSEDNLEEQRQEEESKEQGVCEWKKLIKRNSEGWLVQRQMEENITFTGVLQVLISLCNRTC